MKIKLLVVLVLISSMQIISAQDARSVLDNASSAYNKAGSIVAQFTLDSKDLKSGVTNSYKGKASMKGDKFKIEIPDAVTWFDGKTQWVYIRDNEEVNVSNPTGEELQGISPSLIFNTYKKGYKLNYIGEKRHNGKIVQEVEMIPELKSSDISKISVFIDKATHIFSKIVITDKVGMQNTLTIASYQPNSNLSDAVFVFDKKNYPKAEVIDLR